MFCLHNSLHIFGTVLQSELVCFTSKNCTIKVSIKDQHRLSKLKLQFCSVLSGKKHLTKLYLCFVHTNYDMVPQLVWWAQLWCGVHWAWSALLAPQWTFARAELLHVPGHEPRLACTSMWPQPASSLVYPLQELEASPLPSTPSMPFLPTIIKIQHNRHVSNLHIEWTKKIAVKWSISILSNIPRRPVTWLRPCLVSCSKSTFWKWIQFPDMFG